jgi:hypothetical protein
VPAFDELLDDEQSKDTEVIVVEEEISSTAEQAGAGRKRSRPDTPSSRIAVTAHWVVLFSLSPCFRTKVRAARAAAALLHQLHSMPYTSCFVLTHCMHVLLCCSCAVGVKTTKPAAGSGSSKGAHSSRTSRHLQMNNRTAMRWDSSSNSKKEGRQRLAPTSTACSCWCPLGSWSWGGASSRPCTAAAPTCQTWRPRS